MKLAFAIVCSLFLVWTQTVIAPSAMAGSAQAAKANCHCGSGCCAARATPEPQSTPLAPAPAGTQVQLTLISLPTLLWSQPDSAASASVPTSLLQPIPVGAPLYERNCALLI